MNGSNSDSRSPYALLNQVLRPFRSRLAVAALVFAVKDCPLWLLPLITGAAVDTVVKGGPLAALGWLAIAAAVLVTQNYPAHQLFTRLYMGSMRTVGAQLRGLLAERLQLLSIAFHSRSSAAVMQSKVVRDVENIEMMLTQAGPLALSSLLVFSGAVALTAVNVPQFLPVFALSVPCGTGVWWLMRRAARQRNEEFRRDLEVFAARVGEMTALIPITRAHGLEEVAVERVREVAERVRERGLNLDLVNGRFGAVSWVTMQLLSVACLLVAAAVAVLGWAPITPGQVVLLGTYFSALTGTVTTILGLVPILARGTESLRSVAEVMQDSELEHNEGKKRASEVAGRLVLEDVTVRYTSGRKTGDDGAGFGAGRPALDGVSLTIGEGQTVAFVGPSGSGKSTVVNTVLGFIRPNEGRVLLDGADMAALDLRTVRKQVSVVPQESVLFEGSIYENVAYGLADVDASRVRKALEDANALDFVDALPQGWDTIVGERGARLSGGQRQRLSLARALVREPRILILDEATSALDSESESHIQDALERMVHRRTTLVVAHRLSTVRNADRIVVLDQGKVVETGTHEELLALEGRYARAWAVQVK